MSQILITGQYTSFPNLLMSVGVGSAPTLNATGETCFMIGHVILENPLGGSKTISSAGGGSIVWRAGTSSISAGSNFKVGIQDVSTASTPAQGDGTFDVVASFTTTGITTGAVNTSAMTSGTKTIANGDLIAIGFEMTTRAAPDSVIVSAANVYTLGVSNIFPVVMDNTGGSYTRLTLTTPNAYIKFDDGTLGWLLGGGFPNNVSSLAYNSGTGTADEYGNLLYCPGTFYAVGASINISAANTADYEVLLYSDPLGTPAVVSTVTVDATWLGAASTSNNSNFAFATPYLLKANTAYALTCRPTTANNITAYYSDPATADAAKTLAVGSSCYAVRRLDNTGAFSDYNGGTAKTRVMSMKLLGSYIEQGVNNASWQIGI